MLGRLSSYFGELSSSKLAEYSKPIAWILRCLRMVFYVFDEFVKDNCLQTAASLAYTTLLSLVPLAAISLAILSRFKFSQETSQETIQNFLIQYLLPTATASFQEVIMENIQKFARNTAALSIFGGLFLAITAVALLNTVEGSFNSIWRVTERRNLLSKFTAFWSIITFSPILIGASIVLTSRFYQVGLVGSLLKHELIRSATHYFLPLLVILGVFFFAYRVLPNTKVKAFPAIIGAIIATALFSYARWWFGIYVSQYAHFDRIYGILGTLPAFLIWIYISWVIVLVGAEVTFTFQYHRLDPEEKRTSPGDPVYNPYYGVRVVLALRDHFHGSRGPLSAVEVANRLNITYELMDEILSHLREGDIAASVDEAREKFLPGRDLDQVTLKEIMEAMQGENLVTASLPQDREKEVIEKIFEKAREATSEVLSHTTIKDISTRVSGED
ncbi:MAG: YihY family inner membrane protein [Thermodesulfobacteriota bacterium]